MLKHFLRPCLLALFLTGPARAEDRWANLKVGMTAEETVTALGQPLARNLGRGFELWTYDNQAEVLFFGDLIGWTSPGKPSTFRYSFDIWQANRGKDDFRAVLLLLPPPKPKPRKDRPVFDTTAPDVGWRPTLRFMR